MVRDSGAGGLKGELRQEIREAVERGALVVTGNERAARTVRRGWDELRRAAGAERWEGARAISWSSWTASLWRQMLLEGRARSLLLNPFQEHAVWRGVLASDEDGRGLRGAAQLAAMAAESWSKLWAYAGSGGSRVGRDRPLSLLRRHAGQSRDTAAFARWAGAFAERCAAERLLSAAELDTVLGEAVRSGAVRPEAEELALVGFDRLTPAQEGLVAALAAAGATVTRISDGTASGDIVLAYAADEREELRACARWAAYLVGRDASMRIAVIVPDLHRERAAIERVFREVLAPELEAITAGERDAPYALSLGRALRETPMVSVALGLLRWAAGALPLERASGLLVSEYFAGNAGERLARAEFDETGPRRTSMLQPEIGLGEVVRGVSGWKGAARLPTLVGALRGMERWAGEHGRAELSYGEWAQRFRSYLKEARWGAAAGETSEEYQVRERWDGALDYLSTLDFEDRVATLGEALDTLERITRETVFAPEASSAAVQVMGPLEAAGSEFDAVWLLRAGETSWPPGEQPSPMLGWGLQRELGMPGTDPAREHQRARELTARVLGCGREVRVASYARSAGEVEQRAAAAVRGSGVAEVEAASIGGGEPERAVVTAELEEDGGGASLPRVTGAVKGGVHVLELQAACGFRAFAEQRLGSRELQGRELGMDAREAGNAIHKALECFWAEVESQDALRAMSAAARKETLGRAIEQALGRMAALNGERWEVAYLNVQRTRLHKLLDEWLKVELQRRPFRVLGRESAIENVAVGPLEFRLRVDRVDVVDGRRVLIDYKTGKAEASEWTGDRPDKPQVPLYAILAAREAGVEGEDEPVAERVGTPLGGVAYGTVRAGKEMKIKGMAADSGLLFPGRPSAMEEASFAEQVTRWGEVLERLAGEFAEGDAQVKPKSYPTTCRHCGQRMLCRLDASLLEEMEEFDPEENGDG